MRQCALLIKAQPTVQKGKKMTELFNLLLQMVLGPFYSIFALLQSLLSGSGATG